MIHKVNASRVSEPHLPSTRQGTELGNGLLLDGAVRVVLSTVHADILLAPRVDPGRSARVVVDEVRPPFRGKPLLPTSR